MSRVRVPVDLRNPRVTTLAGNAFFTVVGLTAWDAGHWQFVKDVDGKLYGVVKVPKNLAAAPNGKIVLVIGANATTGTSRLSAATKAVADAESLNPASFSVETAQDIAVPATARLRKDVTVPASGTLAEALAADDLLLVEVFHEGAHANDTLAVNTELYGAYLEVDVA